MKTTKSIFTKILFVIVCSFFVMAAGAQVKPYAFAKVKPEDFSARVYDKDTSAVAVVLGDLGESYFDYVDGKGFQLIFTRHLRIRIFKKEGYDYATHIVSLYKNDNSSESLSDLKGYTFNLINGKVEEEKLGSSNIFDEKVTRNRIQTRFTLPGVKTGSILDIRYKITSDFFWNIQDWEFQKSIPVQWSEYMVTIPEYFVYTKLSHGSIPFVINEITTTPGSVNLGVKARNEGYIAQTTYSMDQVNFIQNVYHYAVSNVPALKEEPFAPASTNFISKIEFELQHSSFPGSPRKDYTTTWQDICDGLIRDPDFGTLLQHGGVVKEAVKEISAIAPTPMEKMIAAHDMIRSRMTWNDKKNLYASNSLREAWEKKTGSSAEINLLLTLLLQQLGLDAAPVILSTRDNGMLLESHPVISQINYIVASATIDGKTYLLDATGKHRPYYFLPERCLNGSGLLVSKTAMRWVPLLGDEKENSLYTADMKIGSDGVVSGVLKISEAGYSAEEIRSDYTKEGAERYYTLLKEEHKEWKIGDVQVTHIDSLNASVDQVYTLSSEDIAQQNGSMIYFNALLGFGQTDNPFKAEKRENVVDFIHPEKTTYVFNFDIPEGYTVESMPDPVKMVLHDQAGMFRFNIGVVGNKISVNSTLSITKTMFTAEEYADLREFFTRIVAKHAQQIVLKKV